MASRKGGKRKLASYGPGEEMVLIKRISKNQREINGMIFRALKQITPQLIRLDKAIARINKKNGSSRKAREDPFAELKEYVQKIPGFDPPGCPIG